MCFFVKKMCIQNVFLHADQDFKLHEPFITESSSQISSQISEQKIC